MNGRRIAGAAGGGLAAGLAPSALLMAGERKSGQPSELADLERAAARRLRRETPAADAPPSPREQAVIQGGHLALSALAGAAYAGASRERAPVLASGAAFGLAFYAAAHWVAGPLLGVKAPEWRAGASKIGLHATNHLAFGVVTAAAATAAARA